MNRKTTSRLVIGLLPVLLLIATQRLVWADLTLTATDSGFVTVMGGSAKGDSTLVAPAAFNYSVGWLEHYADGSLGVPPGSSPLAFMTRKNYFVFDLSSVTSTITMASLELYAGPDIGDPYPDGEHGYESLDPFEGFEILETTDPLLALSIADDLLDASLIGGSAGFDEPTDAGVIGAATLYGLLGDGVPLASYSVTAADDGTTIGLDFTSAGLAYLNLFLGERLILGGELTTLSETIGVTEGIFGFTGPDIAGGDPLTPSLVITTVPEPSGWAILMMATATGACVRRRRRAS